MSARYDNPEVAITGEGRLSVSFRLVNDTAFHWRGAQLGWQVTDGETHRYLEDGPALTFEEDMPSGAARPCSLEGPLPSFAGRYRLFIAPLVPALGGWLHTKGGRALVVDVEIGPDGPLLLASREATMGELARRDILGPPLAMALLVWRNRSLAWSLARRDLAARFRGSIGDALWAVIHPLLLMLTYLFVFGVVLRARFAGDPSTAGFALYFLAGMLPWLAFSEAVGRAPGALLEHRHFVKKLVFPVELLNVSHVLSAMVTQMIGLALLCALLLLLRGSLPATALLIPLLLIPQLLLTLGISWTLSALGVYLRDLGQMIGFALTLLFFLTPICYPEESLPAGFDWYFRKNPVYVLVRAWRAVLLQGVVPPPRMMLLLFMVSLFGVFVSAHLYRKLRPTFADVL